MSFGWGILPENVKKQLSIPTYFALPKLSFYSLGLRFQLPKKYLLQYRDLEEGELLRFLSLDHLSHHHEFFLYEEDMRKLSEKIPFFDAFFNGTMLYFFNILKKSPFTFYTPWPLHLPIS